MRRLTGLLLIIRALAPILMVIVIVLTLSGLTSALQQVVDARAASIRTEVATLQAAIDSAKAQFETFKTQAEALGVRLRAFRLPNILPNLPLNISFPRLDIPDFNIQIPTGVNVTWTNGSATASEWIDGTCHDVVTHLPWPLSAIVETVCDAGSWVTRTVNFQYPSGVTFRFGNFRINFPAIPQFTIPMPDVFGLIRDAVGSLFGGVRDIFRAFDRATAAIRVAGDAVRDLGDGLTQAYDTTRGLLTSILAVLTRWGSVIALVLVIAAAVVVLTTFTVMLDDFTRGWRLLFGKGA